MPGFAASTTRHNTPDASGQAALLLAESMLHILVEAGTLTRDQALDAVRTAVCVQADETAAASEPDTAGDEPLRLLQQIEGSMACKDAGLI